MSDIRFIAAMLLIIFGIFMVISSVIGIFKFKFALNRMHAAAMTDTLALLMVSVGVIVMYGFSLTSLKVLLIIIFLWIASPVSSHLIASLEIMIHKDSSDKNYTKEEQ
ncbi:MAG: monovalent cation/H(+) antiporter subunit G [Lachnospiraceae bacterium]|nr:monovalent cation/H(+) antiporter subunit G [Lachnospiraceae bacterium]